MIRILVLICLASPVLSETLRIGTEADFAPYMFHDETGALTGLDKDLGDALCLSGGWDCTWVEADFASLVPGLMAGQFDIILAGMAITPGRMDLVDFTRPYILTGQSIGVFAGLAADIPLQTARIAVLSGSNQEAHLIKTGRDYIGLPTSGACIDALIAGDVDLVFSTGSYLQSVLDNGLTDLQEVAREEFASLGTAIAVEKGNIGLRDRLNTGLDAMRTDGRLQALVTKWLPNASE